MTYKTQQPANPAASMVSPPVTSVLVVALAQPPASTENVVHPSREATATNFTPVLEGKVATTSREKTSRRRHPRTHSRDSLHLGWKTF